MKASSFAAVIRRIRHSSNQALGQITKSGQLSSENSTAGKLKPKNYSTTVGKGSVVPCQIEAYFMDDHRNDLGRKPSPYESAIQRLRADPGNAAFICSCYLDDPLAAAQRFADSEEFTEVCRILSLGSSNHGVRVLDVGCGNGIASYAFASLGCDVVALEPDPSSIVGAGAIDSLQRNLVAGSITPINRPIEKYTNTDEGFDIVYMRQVAHHFPVLEEGIFRCVELLQPNGVFLMTREHVVDSPLDLEIFRQNHPLTMDGVEECAYSVNRYHQALTRAGLSKITEWGYYESVINTYPTDTAKIQAKALAMMHDKYGRIGALLCRNLSFVESWALKKLSQCDRKPGRMHSFRGIKEIG